MLPRALSIIRKALLILVSESLSNFIGHRFLGVINRLGGNRLTTLFLVYPADPKYVTAVSFRWYAARARWRPRFSGFYSPGPGQWGLVFAVSSPEEALVDPGNLHRLRAIVDELERVKNRVGADFVALSGILPSYLYQMCARAGGAERERTAAIVEQAIHQTLRRTGLQACHPIILIGSAGYIGSAVHSRLKKHCRNPLIGVDSRISPDQARSIELLQPCRNRPALLVNISRNSVLERYLPFLWPQLVILNEVFPEASKTTRSKLAAMGITYLHLAGVRGWALPRFAGPYAGAIPCCALSPGNSDLPADRLIIKQL